MTMTISCGCEYKHYINYCQLPLNQRQLNTFLLGSNVLHAVFCILRSRLAPQRFCNKNMKGDKTHVVSSIHASDYWGQE